MTVCCVLSGYMTAAFERGLIVEWLDCVRQAEKRPYAARIQNVYKSGFELVRPFFNIGVAKQRRDKLAGEARNHHRREAGQHREVMATLAENHGNGSERQVIASADPTRGASCTGKIAWHSKPRCKHSSREIADGQKWNEQATASPCRGGRRGGYGAEDIDREDGKRRSGRSFYPRDRPTPRADGGRRSGDLCQNHCGRAQDQSAKREPDDGMNRESFRSMDRCS